MKKIVIFLLVSAMLLSLISCSATDSDATTEGGSLLLTPMAPIPTESEEETAMTTEEETEIEEIIPHIPVNDPLTWDRINEIPVADPDTMTIDEMRQICVDFFCLQVTFTWTPKSSVRYEVDSNGHKVTYQVGGLYGGIPYVNLGSCNLYRVMDYYDSETGTFDVSMLERNETLMGNACSGSAGLAWGRVINSATLYYTSGLTPKAGFLPLGSYVSNYEVETFGTNDQGIDVSDILAQNDKQTMYESYALLKPADGIVSGGHVRMAKEAAVVVRNEDGTINGEKSYCIFVEQGCYNHGPDYTRTQADGATYQIQGNDSLKVSFAELAKSYLPFTFGEWLGTDPVEKSRIRLSAEGKDFPLMDLVNLSVDANYIITDAYCQVRDSEGKTVFEHVYRQSRHYRTTMKAGNVLPTTQLAKFTDGNHTLHLSAQLSTGERVTFYEGKLL